MAAPMSNGNQHIVSSPDSFPVRTKQCAVEINNHKTELLCSQFGDRTFLVVTQYNKVGTLVSVTNARVTDATGATASMPNIDVLMGNDQPMTHVVARNLITQIPLSKPILLSIALKDNSPKTVKAIAKILPTLM
ncbi:PSMG3-like protein [Mya arenaria]|uniref:PSMG3-like protein n=1 Tax=Mya arenaria TaxID=6604 RepID=A0ABY7FUA6_MYAAR|nr:proteasome assembly chaperone 3-like [Mya arenaria]WAR24627.1 PSMG3-like protein [Mya arenaria]